MFSFSMPELFLILIIALVVFGPSKLPEVGKALGKALQEFKKATSNDITQDNDNKVKEITEKNTKDVDSRNV